MDYTKDKIKSDNFYCELCNYLACDKYNFNRHLLTNKHKKIEMIKNKTNIIEKNNEINNIKEDNETNNIKEDNETNKIKEDNETNNIKEDNETNKIKNNELYKSKKYKQKWYRCNCGKKYKHQTNLIRHKKTNCKFMKNKEYIENIENIQLNEVKYKELIITLVDENNKLKNIINELTQFIQK